MEIVYPQLPLDHCEQMTFAKLLFADILPKVKERFESATSFGYNGERFLAYAKCPTGISYNARVDGVSWKSVDKLTASYVESYITWGSLDTWSGENTDSRLAVVYRLSDDSAAGFDWKRGWDSYDGEFIKAVNTIGEGSQEAYQRIAGDVLTLLFKNPLGLRGWYAVSFEEFNSEWRDDYDIETKKYKKWR